MRYFLLRSLFLVSVCSLALNAFAFDQMGETQMSQTALQNTAFSTTGDQNPLQAQSSTPALSFASMSRTTAMTPGVVKKQQVDIKGLHQAIFIVGTDQRSLIWLEKYRDSLIRLRAIGFVVNVPDQSAYDHVVRETGLHLLPINANAIAKRFHLKHYPVLVTEHVIEQ